jgi:hypothetical protein
MQLRLRILAAVALVLGMSAGCAHRTTTMHSTSETVRTDSGPPAVAPPPQNQVEESTTIIKRSHTQNEEGQQ